MWSAVQGQWGRSIWYLQRSPDGVTVFTLPAKSAYCSAGVNCDGFVLNAINTFVYRLTELFDQ